MIFTCIRRLSDFSLERQRSCYLFQLDVLSRSRTLLESPPYQSRSRLH